MHEARLNGCAVPVADRENKCHALDRGGWALGLTTFTGLRSDYVKEDLEKSVSIGKGVWSFWGSMGAW